MSVAASKISVGVPERRPYALTRAATVSDQLIVSIANFVLTIAIGRAFSVEELAAYGIGLSIGLMVQALQRHAITIPLVLQPDSRAARRGQAIAAEQLVVLAIALAAAAAILLAAQTAGATRYALLVLGSSAVCLLVYVQLEFARAFLTKLGRPVLLIASAAYYAAVVLALAAAALSGWLSYVTLLALLGAAMLVHAAALALAGGVAFRRGLLLLAADLRHYGGWAGLATATYAGYNHIPLLLLGALAAPVHAAVFVATRSLMQPLQILLRGLDIADKSNFAGKARAPYGRPALVFTLKLAALYAIVAGAFGLAAGFFAEQLVAMAYGDKFAGFGPVLIAWIPLYMLLAASMPLESLVYARKSFRGYYLVRGVASAAAIAAAYPLIRWTPDIGAIAACGIGWLIAVAGTFVLLARDSRP